MANSIKGVWSMNTDKLHDELESELKLITDDFNATLKKNTEDLIKRICQEVDMIQDSFDILDHNFNERIKDVCAKDKSHVQELSKND